MKPLERIRSLKVEGKMTESDTGKVMKIHAWGEVLNAVIWRAGLLVLLYRSPDLADLAFRWMMK